MKIRVYSDLHLEFGNFTCPKPTDDNTILVLAGDIGVKKSAMGFIEKYASMFRAVIYVLGNHEYYNGVVSKVQQGWRDTTHIKNLHFLENNTVTIDGIKFCGCTLWTDMNKNDDLIKFKMSRVMNDYSVIRTHVAPGYGRVHRRNDTYLTPSDTVRMHNESIDFLEKEVTNKTVVVTHHTPSSIFLDTDRYGTTDTNYAYFTNLEKFIEQKEPILWIAGHTHKTVDRMMYKTRMISNPRGYMGHAVNELFNPNFDVEI